MPEDIVDIPQTIAVNVTVEISMALARSRAEALGLKVSDAQLAIMFAERLDVLQAVLGAAHSEAVRSFLDENLQWAAAQ